MARIKAYLAAFGGRVAIEELGTDFGTPFNTHVRKNTGRNDGAFRKWLGAAMPLVVKPSLRVRNKATVWLREAFNAADCATRLADAPNIGHVKRSEVLRSLLPPPAADTASTRSVKARRCPVEVAVLDTNQLLHRLDTVRALLSTCRGLTLVLPLMVRAELEKHQRDEGLGHAARQALRVVLQYQAPYENRSTGAAPAVVVAQRPEQAIAPWAASGVPYHPNQDDLILSCALFFKAHASSAVLLTDDKGLSIKAGSYAMDYSSAKSLLDRALSAPAKPVRATGRGQRKVKVKKHAKPRAARRMAPVSAVVPAA